MKATIDHTLEQNQQILEQFFKDTRLILYTKRPLKTKLKMLYAAKHKADYYRWIYGNVIRELCKEK